MTNRSKTRPVRVGNVQIGGQPRVVIQTMTVSKAARIEDTAHEINRYAELGAELVRIAVVDEKDARALEHIKAMTSVPIIADIHFDMTLALFAVAAGADKVRINPGTFTRDEDIETLVKACANRNIPIRIGINAGSLEPDIEAKYGREKDGMIASAQRLVAKFEALGFYDLVLSFKVSDTILSTAVNLTAADAFRYPLHIGVTEAGPPSEGIVKSAAALGTLLYHGIGDTIRISLSGDRAEELAACKRLLGAYGLYPRHTLISCPACGRIAYDMTSLISKVEAYLAQHPTTLKIAVMGCAVNGPGEAREADIGLAGGKAGAVLFKKGKPIRTVAFEHMFDALVQAIAEEENIQVCDK